MNSSPILVIGKNGKTGSRVNLRLQALGLKTRAVSRSTTPAFDWEDASTWQAAIKGTSTAYVTYQPDLAVANAEAAIKAFLSIAAESGLKHIVLLSGRGEQGAERAEDLLKASGLSWNIIRASWFNQNFSESFMLQGIMAGELVLPAGNTLEPFIDVDDIADVVVAALTRHELRNQLLEITGPELLSFIDCVNTIAHASAREIGFTTLPVDTYLQAAIADGLPDDIAWLINELFVNVLDGRNESTTDTVERVLGRPARRFESYVMSVASTGIWDEEKQVLES